MSRYKISRYENVGSAFSDAPDDGQIDRPLAKEFAKEIPCLILLKQQGKEEQRWRGAEFWWPVIITPEKMRTVVFSSDV